MMQTASESMRNVSPVSGEAAEKNKAVAENAADKNVIAEPPEAEETEIKESECKFLLTILVTMHIYILSYLLMLFLSLVSDI